MQYLLNDLGLLYRVSSSVSCHPSNVCDGFWRALVMRNSDYTAKMRYISGLFWRDTKITSTRFFLCRLIVFRFANPRRATADVLCEDGQDRSHRVRSRTRPASTASLPSSFNSISTRRRNDESSHSMKEVVAWRGKRKITMPTCLDGGYRTDIPETHNRQLANTAFSSAHTPRSARHWKPPCLCPERQPTR